MARRKSIYWMLHWIPGPIPWPVESCFVGCSTQHHGKICIATCFTGDSARPFEFERSIILFVMANLSCGFVQSASMWRLLTYAWRPWRHKSFCYEDAPSRVVDNAYDVSFLWTDKSIFVNIFFSKIDNLDIQLNMLADVKDRFVLPAFSSSTRCNYDRSYRIQILVAWEIFYAPVS